MRRFGILFSWCFFMEEFCLCVHSMDGDLFSLLRDSLITSLIVNLGSCFAFLSPVHLVFSFGQVQLFNTRHYVTLSPALFFFKKSFICLFIHLILFLAGLGLHCCVQAFSGCGAQASHCSGLSYCRAWALRYAHFSIYGAWAQMPRSMWDLPRPGFEPVSPSLAGRFLTTGPPGTPSCSFLNPYTISP